MANQGGIIPQQRQDTITMNEMKVVMCSMICAIGCIVYGLLEMQNPRIITYIKDNELKGRYDYIIVGAGTAGSVVASKLALHASNPSILVIEAGMSDNYGMFSKESVPAYAEYKQLSRIDWSYKTVKQEYCCGNYDGKQILWPSGKIFGGSTALSNGIWMIGNPGDYDGWNSKNFNSTEMYRYFRKNEKIAVSELIEFYGEKEHKVPVNISLFGLLGHFMDDKTYSGFDVDKIARYRGTDGSNIIKRGAKHEIINSLFWSSIEYGYNFIIDYNNPTLYGNNEMSKGVAYTQYNINGGSMKSMFKKYMQKMHKIKQKTKNTKKNIQVMKGKYVDKIIWKPKEQKSDIMSAIGIEYIDMKNGGITGQAFVGDKHGEVILCAGVINSPKILMLSGVGNENKLKNVGIKSTINLENVGKNLKDQINFNMYYKVNSMRYTTFTRDLMNNYNKRINLFVFNGDILNTTNHDGIIYYQTNISKDLNESSPDLIFILKRGSLFDFDKKYRNEMYNYADEINKTDGYITISVHLLKPKSVGHIELKSKDPADDVLIQPNYLSISSDLDRLVEGFKEVTNIISQHPFSDIHNNTGFIYTKYNDFKSDSDIRQYINDTIYSSYTPIGTNKLSDIVNDELILSGSNNVRIIDASVIPELITGFIEATVVSLADKGSDIILNKLDTNTKIKESNNKSKWKIKEASLHDEI